MRPAIVIPAYQPEKILVSLVNQLKENYPDRFFIIVDDGSTTAEAKAVFTALSQDSHVILLTHETNQGKGRALKTAFRYCQEHFPQMIGLVTADADGQHLPNDINTVADALEKNPDALILGSRVFTGKIPWRSQFGNKLTRKVFEWFSGKNLNDTQTGLRGIPLSFISALLSIDATGYEFEMAMLISATQNQQRIIEVPISTVYEDGNRSSHFNPLFDSLKIYFVFIRYSLLSILSAGIDFLLFILAFHLIHSISASTLFARIISGTFNFTYCKKLIFKSEGNVLPQAIQYIGLALLSAGLSIVVVSFFFHVAKLNIYASKLIGDSLIFILNFLIQHTFIFRQRKPS